MRLSTYLLLAAMTACFILAGCSMAELERGVQVASGVLTAVAPLIPPDAMAEVQARIAGGAPAVGEAFGAVANALRAFEQNAAAQIADQGQVIAQQAAQIAALPTWTETALVATGTGAGGTALSRGMSAMKHGHVGKKAG